MLVPPATRTSACAASRTEKTCRRVVCGPSCRSRTCSHSSHRPVPAWPDGWRRASGSMNTWAGAPSAWNGGRAGGGVDPRHAAEARTLVESVPTVEAVEPHVAVVPSRAGRASCGLVPRSGHRTRVVGGRRATSDGTKVPGGASGQPIQARDCSGCPSRPQDVGSRRENDERGRMDQLIRWGRDAFLLAAAAGVPVVALWGVLVWARTRRVGRRAAIKIAALDAGLVFSLAAIAVIGLRPGWGETEGWVQWNFVPFRDLAVSLDQPSWVQQIAITNLIGNILLFMPWGVMLTLRFPRTGWAMVLVS